MVDLVALALSRLVDVGAPSVPTRHLALAGIVQ
jgi:hypothetical protein